MTATKKAPIPPPLPTADEIKRQKLRDFLAELEPDERARLIDGFMSGVFEVFPKKES